MAAALWVPTSPSQPAQAAGRAAPSAGSDGSTPKDPAAVDVECGKQDLEAAAASNGASGGAGATPAALSAAAARAAPGVQPKRSRLGPYLKNAVTLLALASSLAAWATYVKCVAQALSRLPAALSSRAAFMQGAVQGVVDCEHAIA